MNKIIRYVFILTIIIVAMLTIIFVMKEKNNKNNKNNEYVKKNIIQKDLRLGVAELDTFNPILSNNRNVYEISKLFYDSLVFIDGTYKPTLLLAEELNKIDDLKYKIKFKKNIKWNGAEGYLTSNDIKFTLERIVDSNSIYKSNIQNIAAITVISDYELELHLKTPDNFLKYKLNFPIMKETNVELFKNTEKYKVPPNIGKYNFLEIKNSTYIFKLNKDYYNFEQKPIIETVTVNIFQNAGEMYNSFKSGNIDILNTLVLDIEKYIGNFGYLKTVYKDREFNYLAFNT